MLHVITHMQKNNNDNYDCFFVKRSLGIEKSQSLGRFLVPVAMTPSMCTLSMASPVLHMLRIQRA